jgi:hypothetical protein
LKIHTVARSMWATASPPCSSSARAEQIAEGVMEEAAGRSIGELVEDRDRLLVAGIKSFAD